MFRIALASLCLATAAPAAFAGDQSLYPHVHTNTPIVGSYTRPINYRPHNSGNSKGRGYVEAEIVRSSGFDDANTKYIPLKRTKKGKIKKGQLIDPVTEIFVENLPALNGG